MGFESITSVAGRLYSHVVRIPREPTEEERLSEEIRKARADLERAESLFNEVTNAEMVDWVSYDIMAAKARYSYLLQKAKEKTCQL